MLTNPMFTRRLQPLAFLALIGAVTGCDPAGGDGEKHVASTGTSNTTSSTTSGTGHPPGPATSGAGTGTTGGMEADKPGVNGDGSGPGGTGSGNLGSGTTPGGSGATGIGTTGTSTTSTTGTTGMTAGTSTTGMTTRSTGTVKSVDAGAHQVVITVDGKDMTFSTNGVTMAPNLKAGSAVSVEYSGNTLRSVTPDGGSSASAH